MTNSSIRRKLTALRSLFSYLQTYGYTGANPAHGEFVTAPAVSRDGKTVGLSPHDCRRLLDAPESRTCSGATNAGRDSATGPCSPCWPIPVAASASWSASASATSAQRRAPHPQHHRQGRQGTDHAAAPGGGRAASRMAGRARHRRQPGRAALSRRAIGPRQGRDGFAAKAMTTRAVEKLIEPLRRGPRPRSQRDGAFPPCHRPDHRPRTRQRHHRLAGFRRACRSEDDALTYIRSRDRLSKSPAYVLKY